MEALKGKSILAAYVPEWRDGEQRDGTCDLANGKTRGAEVQETLDKTFLVHMYVSIQPKLSNLADLDLVPQSDTCCCCLGAIVVVQRPQ
jgi:hypothetical protein